MVTIIEVRLGDPRCPECDFCHNPEDPHVRQSYHYRLLFHLKNGREPGVNDAWAHCTENVKAKAVMRLRRFKVENWLRLQEEGP